jgi:PAS domain S-box-containing protein
MVPTPISQNARTNQAQANSSTGATEQLFRAIFEQAAVGVAQIDTTTGRFIRVNQRYCDIVGVTKDELTADTFMAITYPDDLQADLDNMEALKAGRIRSFVMEKRYVRSDGATVWVHLSVSPLWDAGHQPTSHVAVVQDITDRKRTEALLETDKYVLELIASGAPLTEVLERLCCLFEEMSPGLLSSILLLDQDRLYLHHGAAPSLPAAYRAAIDGVRIGPSVGSCGTAAYLQRQVIVTDIANDLLWTEYQEIALKHHLSACWSAPVFSKGGSVLGTFAMYYREPRSPSAHDLQINEHATKLAAIAIERKQAEEALRTGEQFRREVLDSLSAQVAVVDREGTIVAVNRAWDRAAAENDLLRVSKISVGANYLDVCRCAANGSSEVRRTLDGISDVLLRQREIFESEYLCVLPDRQRWFAMRVTPLSGHDGGAVITHEDITERKQAFEALQEAYSRIQIMGRELHLAEELERRRLSRELHDDFGQLLSALKFDLKALTDEMVKNPDFSSETIRTKMKVATGMVDRLFISLRQMVHALRPTILDQLGLIPALESLASEMQGRSGFLCRIVATQCDIRKSFGLQVESAFYRMAQELLNNVVTHARATSATITFECTSEWTTMTVQDDGRGFNIGSVQSHDRFGLRGVRERVELLGGSVEIRSQPGTGTVVTVRVPMGATTADGLSLGPPSRLKAGVGRKRRRHGEKV